MQIKRWEGLGIPLSTKIMQLDCKIKYSFSDMQDLGIVKENFVLLKKYLFLISCLCFYDLIDAVILT